MRVTEWSLFCLRRNQVVSVNSDPNMKVAGPEQESLTLLLIDSETVGTRFKHPEVKTS